ncbi:hypothetical protein [Streptomyces lonarensis]|uniref:Pyridoxamine 5'-phosphate oxidase putative domain-containing protein n=1 Tax=Streptomyces lonarensis TaxID=700599 RepID=A0A7X6I0U1_9ACTN|nr:hypothetical protein [Streptomyces lonarensis]NJQ08071.1 hypothetical protein [Streptomyces lonarensis]
MTEQLLRWSDTEHDVMAGDLTVAIAYLTPAGGAVVTAVSPVGTADRATGRIGFTTSLGFPRKLDRILRDPRMAMAYHTRTHGFATHDAYVLAQGPATVDLSPPPERLDRLLSESERFLGPGKQGPLWDRLLREYDRNRVFVDIDVRRLVTWPDAAAGGAPAVTGPARAEAPEPQRPPGGGTAPRVPVAALAKAIRQLPHRLLAYRGADGFPVIVPVTVSGHDGDGLRLAAPAGLLPPGGRRAGFLAHRFGPQCVGLSTRMLTGWLTVDGDGEGSYAPHTSQGMTAPANRTVQALGRGLLAKRGVQRARRDGTEERLRSLAGNGGRSPGS